MGDGMDPKIIKKTQETLGKHVKKPQLQDKLLMKPPFKFLQDIVVNIIKNTGFLQGLFNEKELDSKNVPDRNEKIEFLNKLINAIQTITNSDVNVRASKVVAGLEVEKTNFLLQTIASALDQKLDSSDYVEKYRKGKITSKTESLKIKKPSTKDVKSNKIDVEDNKKSSRDEKLKENKTTKTSEKLKEKKVHSTRDKKNKDEKTKISSTRSKTENKSEKIKKIKKIESQESIASISPKEKSEEIKDTSLDQNNIENSLTSLDNIAESNDNDVGKINDVGSRPKTRYIENGYLSNKIKENKIENENISVEPKEIENEEILKQEPEKTIETTHIRQTSARPKSARPKSGEFKDKQKSNIPEEEKQLKSNTNENIVLQSSSSQRPKSSLRPPSVRPSSARPGAPRLRPDSALPIQEVVPMGKINVIVENFDKDIDDEETVVIHNAPEELINIEPILELPAKNQSHLVEQILDQIKDNEDVSKNKLELDWDQDNLRGRDTMSKEMNQLKNSIQSFTKTANPLGKLLNYLHEDIETMHLELQQWSKVSTQLFEDIAKQQKLKAEMDKPLKEKLIMINDEIIKQEKEIINLRNKILKNDKRIKDLICLKNST